MLKRKVDNFLKNWKNRENHMPLIIKGARQIGKTESIRKFAKENYTNVIEINFILQKTYKDIFDDGFEVDTIIKNISLKNRDLHFEAGNTLIFFDEIQACINVATSLKSFMQDKRFDVICSGTLTRINYNEIESVSVGYKEDYQMYSLDFEEFLIARGFNDLQLEDLYLKMLKTQPLGKVEYSTYMECFHEYMVIGGMPKVVDTFVKNNNFMDTLMLQRQIILDYEEDITKYAMGLDKSKVLNTFRKIPIFLGKDNKKFQISKITHGARNREYVGVVEWLESAGIVNQCFCLESLELPLKGNYEPNNYKLYFMDTGLLVASLDEEAQIDLTQRKNYSTYKGAIYENIVADMLVKSGYSLYFYRNEKSTIEMDFFVRDANTLIPVEVEAKDNSTPSLNKLINDNKYEDIKYGIKFCDKNIGYNGSFYTFPYFMVFLLKRFLREKNY